MELEIDAAAEARIERVRKHLPAGTDLTLVTLKGHLLVEEALDGLIATACSEPHHLENVEIRFFVKARLARALCGHILWPGLWPMIDALNAIRNDLAHHLDSPKLQERVVRFLNLRREHMALLDDPPIDPTDWSAVGERFRSDLSLLLGQLTGGEIMVRTVGKQAQPVIPADASQAARR